MYYLNSGGGGNLKKKFPCQGRDKRFAPDNTVCSVLILLVVTRIDVAIDLLLPFHSSFHLIGGFGNIFRNISRTLPDLVKPSWGTGAPFSTER